MTRVLAISQRQAQTLFRAAEAEQAIVEVKIGNTVIRLIPKCYAEIKTPAVDVESSPSSFDTLDAYKVWREKTRAGRD